MTRYLIVCAALTGCVAVTPEAFKGPDGGQAYVMRCSGGGRSLAECYRKASDLCPTGYHVIEQRSATAIVPTALGPIGAPQHSLAVECKS